MKVVSADGVSEQMVVLRHEQWVCINNMILDIYRSDDLYTLRINFLDSLAQLIPHQKSWFDLGQYKENRIDFYDPVSTTMTEKELTDYYEIYQTSDYVPWSFISQASVIYRDSDILRDPLREQTFFYKNWLEPMGVYYGMGSTVVENGILYGSITIFRSKDLQDFSPEEMFILTVLTAHISNHLAIRYPNGINKTIYSHSDNQIMEKFNITEREYQVLELICKGLNNREIGNTLNISENTVKKHINNLFNKLGVKNRSQVINLVYKDLK